MSVARSAVRDRQIRPRKPRDELERIYVREVIRKDVQEKLLRVEALVTVLKLTQVGETSSLRRSGEWWLRNSAK